MCARQALCYGAFPTFSHLHLKLSHEEGAIWLMLTRTQDGRKEKSHLGDWVDAHTQVSPGSKPRAPSSSIL